MSWKFTATDLPKIRAIRAIASSPGAGRSRGRHVHRCHARSALRICTSFCQCRGRTRHSRSSYRDSFRKARGHRTKGQRAHPSATAGSGLLVACSPAVADRRSLAPVLRFHPATDDLLKYLSTELEIARGPGRKLPPGTTRGHAPIAPSGESPASAEGRGVFRNPLAKRVSKTTISGKWPGKGEKRLGHCPNRLPGCVLEVVLIC